MRRERRSGGRCKQRAALVCCGKADPLRLSAPKGAAWTRRTAVHQPPPYFVWVLTARRDPLVAALGQADLPLYGRAIARFHLE